MKLAWHYTVSIRAAGILSAGELRPSTAFVPASEIPIVWFSTRQHWEPTANKALQNADGHRVPLDFDETIEYGGGGWRFGVAVDQLTPWRRLKLAAHISPDMAAGLVRAAKRCGADPSFWYGSLKPVRMSVCLIERLTDGRWIAATGGSCAALRRTERPAVR